MSNDKEIQSESKRLEMQYFIDVHGVIYTLFADGSTNAPYIVQVNGDYVEALSDDHVFGEFTLHPSLTVLARVIEGD